MSRSIPFHKQTDPNKQAGQIVFSPPVPNTGFDREPYLKHSNVAPDVTLSDYIARKQETPLRMTFNEWAKQHNVNGLPLSLHGLSDNEWELMETIWNAALKQGKL